MKQFFSPGFVWWRWLRFRKIFMPSFVFFVYSVSDWSAWMRIWRLSVMGYEQTSAKTFDFLPTATLLTDYLSPSNKRLSKTNRNLPNFIEELYSWNVGSTGGLLLSMPALISDGCEEFFYEMIDYKRKLKAKWINEKAPLEKSLFPEFKMMTLKTIPFKSSHVQIDLKFHLTAINLSVLKLWRIFSRKPIRGIFKQNHNFPNNLPHLNDF